MTKKLCPLHLDTTGIDMGESSDYWLGHTPTWKPEPYTLPDAVTIKEKVFERF